VIAEVVTSGLRARIQGRDLDGRVSTCGSAKGPGPKGGDPQPRKTAPAPGGGGFFFFFFFFLKKKKKAREKGAPTRPPGAPSRNSTKQ